LAAYYTPKCPKPPIPITATLNPGLQYLLKGENVVTPAHNKGALLSLGNPSGMWKHHSAGC